MTRQGDFALRLVSAITLVLTASLAFSLGFAIGFQIRSDILSPASTQSYTPLSLKSLLALILSPEPLSGVAKLLCTFFVSLLPLSVLRNRFAMTLSLSIGFVAGLIFGYIRFPQQPHGWP